MTVFPLVEHYRAELRAQPRARLGAAELADQESDDRGAVQSLAIEGLHGTPEIEALFAMLHEERAPAELAVSVVDRYVRDRLVPMAAAETASVAAAS